MLYPNAVRVFFTGENIAPDFQMCDYAIGFERLLFGDRYIRFPFYYGMYEYAKDLKLAEEKIKILPKNYSIESFVVLYIQIMIRTQ
ncbi:MAG: hypothetical protein ACLVBP_13570 [Ruminococcus sp.]